MGAACSGNSRSLMEDGQTISVLIKDKKQNHRKLLLLGSGDSGKSTLFRHMSLLYTGTLSEVQRRNYGFLIVEAILEWMQTTVTERRSESQHTKECTDTFLADEEAVLEATASNFKDIISSYKRLWETDAYKKVWERHLKIHLPAFFPYFIERLGTISEPDYLATDDDILHVRLRTTGVQSVNWDSPDGLHLELVDVGGQRSERRKWMHCFDDVSAVLYVVDVSSYGETCWEDNYTQCMTETLQLFNDIVTSEFLKDSLIFLVCNKDDRLQERVSKVPLVDSDPTYSGPNEYDAVFQHLHNKFQTIFNDADQFNRTLMIVKTNAVDTNCISSVYNDILKSVT